MTEGLAHAVVHGVSNPHLATEDNARGRRSNKTRFITLERSCTCVGDDSSPARSCSWLGENCRVPVSVRPPVASALLYDAPIPFPPRPALAKLNCITPASLRGAPEMYGEATFLSPRGQSTWKSPRIADQLKINPDTRRTLRNWYPGRMPSRVRGIYFRTRIKKGYKPDINQSSGQINPKCVGASGIGRGKPGEGRIVGAGRHQRPTPKNQFPSASSAIN